jgi:hypothetical protein
MSVHAYKKTSYYSIKKGFCQVYVLSLMSNATYYVFSSDEEKTGVDNIEEMCYVYLSTQLWS